MSDSRSAAWRGLAVGFVATSAMTATTALEQRLRPHLGHPVDYDASDAPATAAARVLRLHPTSRRQRRLLFLLVHWGYGSLVGILYLWLDRRITSRSKATGTFYLAIQAMAFALLPTLGGTPPPWAWQSDMLATSLVQHGVYAAACDAAARTMSNTERGGPIRRRR